MHVITANEVNPPQLLFKARLLLVQFSFTSILYFRSGLNSVPVFYSRIYGLDDIISVLQQNRLRWYGHVLQKEDNDWVKKCMEYEMEGARPRGRPKKIWREIMGKDCQVYGLNREDAMDRIRWMKQIRDD